MANGKWHMANRGLQTANGILQKGWRSQDMGNTSWCWSAANRGSSEGPRMTPWSHSAGPTYGLTRFASAPKTMFARHSSRLTSHLEWWIGGDCGYLSEHGFVMLEF